MDGELKGMAVIASIAVAVVVFILVCAPILGIHIPVPILK